MTASQTSKFFSSLTLPPSAMGRLYHVQCFACSQCSTLLLGQVFGIWHFTFGIWISVFGILQLLLYIRYLAFGILHSVFGIFIQSPPWPALLRGLRQQAVVPDVLYEHLGEVLQVLQAHPRPHIEVWTSPKSG